MGVNVCEDSPIDLPRPADTSRPNHLFNAIEAGGYHHCPGLPRTLRTLRMLRGLNAGQRPATLVAKTELTSAASLHAASGRPAQQIQKSKSIRLLSQHNLFIEDFSNGLFCQFLNVLCLLQVEVHRLDEWVACWNPAKLNAKTWRGLRGWPETPSVAYGAGSYKPIARWDWRGLSK